MTAHPANHKLEGHAAGDHDPEVVAHMAECAACRTYVERSMAAAQADASPFPFLADRTARSTPRVVRIAFALAPLAAAALVVLLVRGRAVAPIAPPAPEVGSTQFKGGLQLAVIRERGGDQARFATGVTVRAFDRLRVEVSVDREGPITVGVLGDDGSWVPLLAPTLLGAGTHFSERAADVDAHATAGHILAGDPEAVLRARTTRVLSGVAVLEILPEP